MTQKLLALIPLSTAILLTVFLAIELTAPDVAPKKPSPMIGKKLPSTTLPLLYNDRDLLSDDDFIGKYTLLNVFSSWCFVCTVEHPKLMKLSEKLSIIGIDWKDEKESAYAWLQKYGNPYQKIGWDYYGEWVIELGITGAPESFLISPEGIILYHYAGALTPSVIEKEILSRIP